MSKELDDLLLNLPPLSSETELSSDQLSSQNELHHSESTDSEMLSTLSNPLENLETPSEIPNPSPDPTNLSAPTSQPPAAPKSSQPVSRSTTTSSTLSQLSGDLPQTTCARCPAAIWYLPVTGELAVHCRIMHRNIEELLEACDGQAIAAQLLQQ